MGFGDITLNRTLPTNGTRAAELTPAQYPSATTIPIVTPKAPTPTGEVPTGKPYTETKNGVTTTYDDNGNITSRILTFETGEHVKETHNPDGSGSSTDYNASGAIVKERLYYPNDELKKQTDFYPDGKIKAYEECDENGNTTHTLKNFRNATGNEESTETFYNKYGDKQQEIYRTNGKLTSDSLHNADGSYVYTSYDASGIKTSAINHDVNSNITKFTRFDKDGNIIQ